MPRRTTMLQIADRIAEINERGLNRAEERLAASAENLRWSLLVTFGIALLGGIVLALATTGLTLRLEREVERRLEETTERVPICRRFRRGWCARRKTNAARWRANCTTKWASRSPPS